MWDFYYLYEVNMTRITHNTHHILAKSELWTNHPDNKTRMEIQDHRNLHNFFGNSFPHQQIEKILGISETVWLPDQLSAIDNLLKSFGGEYYKPHCLREPWTKFKKSGSILVPDYDS